MTGERWLIAWTFTKVQPFISAARKGRDLWYASWLLSDVARAAARRARDEGATLVSPANPDRLDDPGYGVANKVLAVVDGDRERAVRVAEALGAALRDHLTGLAGQLLARDELRAVPRGRLYADRARQQIAEALRDAWVVVPVDGDLPAARVVAEHLLTATKAARGITQPAWAAPVPKASVDGERESVLDEALYDRAARGERATWARALDLRPAERACGVTLLKRLGPRLLGPDQVRVESTSHFAAMPFLQQFAAVDADSQAQIGEAWRAFTRAVNDEGGELSSLPRELPVVGRHDAHLLYASRLHDITWRAHPGREALAPDAVLRAHKALLSTLRRARASLPPDRRGPPSPSPYFAVIVGDGDRIGDTLRRAGSQEDLAGLMTRLDRFADAVGEQFEAHGGQAVYAGGDDLLGFAPVDRVLELLDALHAAFTSLWTGLPRPPTLSVGVAIAPPLTSLRETLDAARGAEKAAKDTYHRDAWAIALHKRGGAPVRVGGKWDNGPAGFAGVRALVDHYTHRRMPRGLPYDVQQLDQRLLEGSAPPSPSTLLALRGVLAQKDRRLPGWRDLALPDVLAACEALGLERAVGRLIVARALTGFDAEEG